MSVLLPRFEEAGPAAINKARQIGHRKNDHTRIIPVALSVIGTGSCIAAAIGGWV
jgi:hypothetical protein